MISYAEALRIIHAAAVPLPPRTQAATAATDGTFTATLRSANTVPPFDNSAMDGFALRASETSTATPERPVVLAVTGMVAAGSPPATTAVPHGAWEIMTGAPVPAGCDAVVPLERVSLATDAGGIRHITLTAPVAQAANVRHAGEDFAAGTAVAAPGTPASPELVMALAAIGAGAVPVIAPPRVTVICTGDELAPDAQPLGAGMIRDVNGPYLDAFLRSIGMPVIARHRVADDPRAVAALLARCAPDCDVILTTGGVSAGRLDFLPGTIRDLRGDILFHKVSIRPGKPVMFARLPNGPLVFGLPGNPIAVAACLRFLVIPALRALQGRGAEDWLPARCATPLTRPNAFTFFAKARAEVSADAQLRVHLLAGQESFRIRPMLEANCWAILPEGCGPAPAGTLVDIAPLRPGGFPAAATEQHGR